jgi:PEGA domain
MRWTPLLLAASAAALVPTSAEARPRQRQMIGLIVVAQEEAEASTARALRQQLRRAYAKDRRALVVDPLRALADRPVQLDQQTATQIQQGYVALEARRYREAVARFVEALRTMLGDLASVPKSQLADVQVHLAAAQLGSGRRRAAQRTLEHVLTWRSRHPLRLRLPAPRGWARLVREVRDWAVDAREGSVRVTSVPPGAEAFVDGKRLGPTPTRVSGLTTGTHYLTLKLEGYQRVVMPLKVALREETTSVQLRKEEQVFALVQDLHSLRTDLGLPQVSFPALLRDQLGLNKALVVVVRGPRRISAYLYRLSNGRRTRRIRSMQLRMPLRAQAIRSLALWRAGGPAPTERVEGGGEEQGTDKAATTSPWYKRWWVWGLVGAAAVAGVVIPVTLASQADEAGATQRFQVSW